MPMINDDSPVEFSDPLPAEVDVVVIGAGIIGTSTAFFLARQGVSVLLCEKGRVAGEQSSRNWGWVRQQGRDAAELPIMMESNRIWRGLAETAGDEDLRFTEAGCYYVAEDEPGLAKFELWHDLARQHGLDTVMVSGRIMKDRFPGITGEIAGGMYTASDGRAEPFVAVPALARAASRGGALVRERCAVRTLDVEAGQIAGVVTEKGRVRCRQLVLSGGVWSTYFAANAGINLPQLGLKSTVARTVAAPANYPSNLSMDNLNIRRRDDGGYTVAPGEFADHYVSPESFRYFSKFFKLLKDSPVSVRLHMAPPRGYPGAWSSPRRWLADDVTPFENMRVLNPPPSKAAVQRIVKTLPQRLPDLGQIKIAEAWAGIIDVTPDAVPILDDQKILKGLFIATGLSGHGFGIGPAIGRIMADLVRRQSPGHDLERFRGNRFTDGSSIEPGPL